MAVYGCTGTAWNATSHEGCVDIVSRAMLATGTWELHEPAEMASMLPITLPKHGGVFLDVGANLGYYTTRR